jgi:biopolymer transport protein ExbD
MTMDIQQPQNEAKDRKDLKKHRTKIDMTSMVDLAFLLLTFFILTASFTSQRQFEPSPLDGPVKKGSNGITILLSNDKEVYWYEGTLKESSQIKRTNYSDNGLRKILNNSKIFYRSKNIKLSVIIKTDRSTSYQNVINTIDELRITDVKQYSVQDMDIREMELIPRLNI